MQTAPTGWSALFAAAHKTEYKFEIAVEGQDVPGPDLEIPDSYYDPETGNLTIFSATEYESATGNLSVGTQNAYHARHIKSAPTITKPLMDSVSIGRCATGSLTLQVFNRPGITIPKAAEVKAYCRLASVNGATKTNWVQLGHYYVSNRSTKGDIITLLCHDDMMKGGAPYLDHTEFTEWPQSMANVVDEIASIMDVDIDSRTVIKTGADYNVDFPDDLLMTEVLGMIAAAHGGNWIITETGKLRLVTLATPASGVSIGTAYKSLTMLAMTETISRVTLTDNADNVFSAGNDTGTEITAACNYATQTIVNALGASGGSLKGVTLKPYALSGAYINPLLELGDSVATTVNGVTTNLYVASISIKCTVAFTADLGLGSNTDAEDEYPYKTARELAAERYVSMGQSYFGNRINRSEGFVSEYTVNDEPVARLIANSNVLSMQQKVDGEWKDRIYFDPVAGKYQIASGVVQSRNSVSLTASGAAFIKAAGATGYTPENITLTAEAENPEAAGITYAWYKDGTQIASATGSSITVSASDITGNSATYSVTVTDETGSYHDQETLIKLEEASGEDGYSVFLTGGYIEIPTGIDYKPMASGNATVGINVYKGLTALTMVGSGVTPAAGQYSVTYTSASGISIARQTATNSLSLSWTTANAIADSAHITVTVSVYGGFLFTADITVKANLNATVISHDSAIEQNAQQISLRVSQSAYNAAIPAYGATAPANPTQDQLWYDSAHTQLKKWNGTAWVNTTADASSVLAYEEARIDAFANELTLSVTSAGAEYSNPSGSQYGFTQGSDGWYQSENYHVANSYSYARLDFNLASSATITIQYDVSSESNYDFGIFSNLDQVLSYSNASDTTYNQRYAGSASGSFTMTIPSGQHYITVKYRKDGSTDNGDDRLRFKISGAGGNSRIHLSRGGVDISAADIVISGVVTFTELTDTVTSAVNGLKTDLSTAGSTTINGGNITTGFISANRIDLSSLHVTTVYFDESTNYPVIKSKVSDDDDVWSITEVGIQNPSVNSCVYIYGKSIEFREYTYDTPPFQLEINTEHGYVNANSFDVYINRVFVGDAGSGFLYFDFDNRQLRFQNLWSGRNTVIAN